MKGNGEKKYSYLSALMLAEEGLQLVARSGVAAFTVYLIGTLPFLAGAIFYWSTMSYSAVAQHYASPGAFGLALLFIWMKTLQSRFGQHLRNTLMDGEIAPWSTGAFFRALCRQAALHATAVVVYPVATLFVLPMAYVVAWYQNVSLMDDGGTYSLRELSRNAARQAVLWPRQNHALLWLASPLMAILCGVLYLVTFPVLDGLEQGIGETSILLSLGWVYGGLLLVATLPLAPVATALMIAIASTIYFGIELFHMLSGAETLYTRNPMALLGNSTFVALVCSLTYVALDPVLKAAYAIRCHEGSALQSGADLLVALQRIKKGGQRAVAGGLILLSVGLYLHGGPAFAQTSSGTEAASIDSALREELAEARYMWRMPREARPPSELPWLLQAITDFAKDFREFLKSTITWVRDTWDELKAWFRGDDPVPAPHGFFAGVSPSLRLLAVVVGALLVMAIGYLVWLSLQQRNQTILEAVAPLEAKAPDIEDEATTAADMPEDEWLAMAQNLAAAGDFRLAARALFFSILATLARYEVIRIARFKSNRDYQNELGRRASSIGEAPKYFSRIALKYESVWYGEHEATLSTLNEMHADQEQLRHAVE